MSGRSDLRRHECARELCTLDADQHRRSSKVSNHQPEDSGSSWSDVYGPRRVARFTRRSSTEACPTARLSFLQVALPLLPPYVGPNASRMCIHTEQKRPDRYSKGYVEDTS